MLRLLHLDAPPARSEPLERHAGAACRIRSDEVSIGLVGKYVEYEDSYKSLKEALLHGGLAHQLKVNIHWIEAEGVDGPSLGARNWTATTASWCPAASASAASTACSTPSATPASSKVPYFGICLGMQTMVIEFARNVCGLARRRFHRVRSRHAPSRDLQAARIERHRRTGRHHAPGQLAVPPGRGQLRLPGLRRARDQRAPPPPLRIQPRIRGAPDGRTACASPARPPTAPTSRSARSRDHPWFLGCQFHPEFKSKPLEPHPLFKAFIGAAYEHRAHRLAAADSADARAGAHCTRVPIEFARLSAPASRWC